METDQARSIITCDLEGRIETYNEGAERLFGYTPAEVIGHKRVSVFSPGHVVLGHIGHWLKLARDNGEFQTRTVFLKNDGTPFPATIRITPTYKHRNGRRLHTGYCGMTAALSGVTPDDVLPETDWTTRLLSWVVITRAPFLTATLIPVLIAAAWVESRSILAGFPWELFVSALLGAASLHISANTFNDYFDWRSGADQANNDYFVPYTGGSRAIELGLISERKLLGVAIAALVLSVLAVIPVLVARVPVLLVFGVVGAALAYFYTAPPLRLCARRGLGELSVMLAFGPLLTAGMVFALTGNVETNAFLIGLPMGFLAGAIFWVNEFPDAEADAMAGKNNLLVTVGKRTARWGYVILVSMAYLSAIALVSIGTFPLATLIVLLAMQLAGNAAQIVYKHHLDRELVGASKATIQLHALYGALLAAGIIWSAF